jgi:hypothetical protein
MTYRLLPALLLLLLLRPVTAAAEVSPAPERRYTAANTLGDEVARSPGSAELRHRDGGRTADRRHEAGASGSPAPGSVCAMCVGLAPARAPGSVCDGIRPHAERLPYHANAPPLPR